MKYKTVYQIIHCAALALFAVNFTSYAQAQVISASAVPDSVTVGDEITLNITVQTPKDVQVTAPQTDGGFGNFAVRDYHAETKVGKDYDTTLYRYTLAIYKPQNCTIPPVSFLISKDSLVDTLASQAIPINIISVLPQIEDGEELAIRDLKNQQTTGRASAWWLWLIIITLIAAAVFYIYKKFVKSKTAAVPVIPQKPPYEEAIEAITILEEKKLLQQGFIKEYVFELSEIFKRYIGRRFDTNAPELTTDEIVSWLESSTVSKELRLNAEWFFRTSDPVKFARWLPDSQTLERFAKEVRKFLEATRPMPEVTETQQVKAESSEKTERVS
ncbi:MAG: BatD family protein [Chitinispirillales bacterium]|jgi:hypothetical protein|nr:BatD family protein [Chitinispirillales bacterium]